ncbi:MAG TPA: lysylphosphatidylglycerol synthase transmembrane domain-containing protein [Verrucomicrobiae bacterium]
MKKPSSTRNFWKIFWRIAVCVLLLGWIFQAIFWNEGRLVWERLGRDWEGLTRLQRLEVAWKFGPPGLWETLHGMDLKFLVLSTALMGVLLLVGVLRWQIILKVHGLNLPLRRTAQIALIGHFFNSFLLGSIGGDVLKAYYVARETHHKKTEAVVTVAVDRIIGLFSLLILACAMMLPARDYLAVMNPKLKPVIWLIFAMAAGCAVFIFISFWGGLSRGVPNARLWLRKLPKSDLIERSIEGFREFGRDNTFFFRVLPVSMLGNLVCILHFLTLIWGFHLSAPVIAIAAIVPIVTCISTLPITPSGLGVRENLYVWFLLTPGIDILPAQALLISLIGFGTSLFWSIVGGVVYVSVKDREHLEEIATEADSAPLRT